MISFRKIIAIIVSCISYAVLGLLTFVFSYIIFGIIDGNLRGSMSGGADPVAVIILYILLARIGLPMFLIICFINGRVKNMSIFWCGFILIYTALFLYYAHRSEGDTFLYYVFAALGFAIMQFFVAFISLNESLNIRKIIAVIVSCISYAVLVFVAIAFSYAIFKIIDLTLSDGIGRAYISQERSFLYVTFSWFGLLMLLFTSIVNGRVKNMLIFWCGSILFFTVLFLKRFSQYESGVDALLYNVFVGLSFVIMLFFAAFISLKIGNLLLKPQK